MDRALPSPQKGVALAVVGLLMVAGLGVVAYQHHAGSEVALTFADGEDGFRTHGGHGAPFSDSLLEIVERTVDDYVEHLEVLRPFSVIGTTVETPLVNVTVHADAFGINETYIDTGYVNISAEGVLYNVPAEEVAALLQNLTDQGHNLTQDPPNPLPSSSPSPSPTPTEPPEEEEDEPVSYVLEDREKGHRYAYIFVYPEAERVDVVLLETDHFGGLHITATPFVVEHRSGDGDLLDLWVRNPVEATLGDLHYPLDVRDVACAAGECTGKTMRDWPLCTNQGQCTMTSKSQAANISHEGGPIDLPGTLLHLWARDAVTGGVGLTIGDEETHQFSADRWSGHPLGNGLSIEDENGTHLLTVALRVPTSEDPSLGYTLSGPAVQTLAGDDLAHHESLDRYNVDISWGPIHLTNADAYRSFDLLHGLLVGTWEDGDGTIRAAHITRLADPEPLVTLVEGAEGEITAAVAPLRAEAVYQAGRIEQAAGLALPLVDGLTGPAERAAFDIVDVATGEAAHQVRVVEDLLDCGLTTLGCLGVAIGPAEDLMGELGIPSPLSEDFDPEVFIGGLPVPGQAIIAYVNALAGTVIGYVPDPENEVVPCDDPATLLSCLFSLQPGELVAAAIGFVGQTVPAFTVASDIDNETVGLYDGSGNALAAYDAGTVYAADHLARLGGDELITIGTPTETFCIRHSFDAAALLDGAWPSVETGCDGLFGQHWVVQPGAQYRFDATGHLQELSVHHPGDPDELLLFYHDDGEATTIVAGPGLGIDPLVVPSTLVSLSGNPATSSRYSIDIAGQSRTEEGALHGVTQVRDAWLLTERLGRLYLPDALSGLIFDVTHGPDSKPFVSDGRNHLSAGGAGAFDGGKWLSGLRDNAWLVTADADAPMHLDLIYRIGTAPDPSSSSREGFQVVGFNDTSGERTYAATVDSETLGYYQTGGVLHSSLAWTARHGTITTTVIDDHDGRGYRYLVDTDRPLAAVDTPAVSSGPVFFVSWSGSAESGSGLGTYHVAYHTGDGQWSEWIGGRHVTEPTQARFTGAPDTTYTFRAKACDRVDNCGAWSETQTTQVAAEAAPAPSPGPSLNVVRPVSGSTVSGSVALEWAIDHAVGTDPIINIAVRDTSDDEWLPLYSGYRTSTQWHTHTLYDGPYQIRFTASDGSRSDTTIVDVQLDNGRSAPSLGVGGEAGAEGPGGAGPTGQEPDDGSERERSPAAPILLLGVLLGGLLGWGRRRRTG